MATQRRQHVATTLRRHQKRRALTVAALSLATFATVYMSFSALA